MEDATGTLFVAFFLPYDCSIVYLKLLHRMVTTYGISLSIYQDRHSSLHRNDDHWSLEEQLAVEQDPTQVRAALEVSTSAIHTETTNYKRPIEFL